ncbi:MAG: S49 family peptidase, partial [Myxococcota bacterium]|nr:S49 family peptidase [Myxococcota bacterium]
MSRRALTNCAPWVGMLFAASACAGAEPAPWDRPDDSAATPVLVEIRLDAAPVEGGAFDPFDRSQVSVLDVVSRIATVREAPEARGLFVRLGPMHAAWARVLDLAEAFALLRAAGKPVHCHFDVLDNAGYLLAARACNRISMSPAGELALVGPSMHVFYARSLLQTLGIEADLVQVGRYKGAADPLTRDRMPEETRESLGALLDALLRTLLDALGDGRGLEADRARALLDEGPFDAASALEAGLVDGVQFDDAARETARRAVSADRVRTLRLAPEAGSLDLAELLEALSGESGARAPRGPRIALMHLTDVITDDEAQGPESGRAGPFVRAARRLADDEDVRAVVLRVDSPGGSAIASDRMWHAVHLLAQRKPVIVSVGDMAASGGYYVASAGTEILAHPTSLVGSIGVV